GASAGPAWRPPAGRAFGGGARGDSNPPRAWREGAGPRAVTPADPATVAWAAPGTPLYRTTFNDIAPRLGASYRLRDDPGRETVVRGGWGVFFDLGSNAVIDSLGNSYPFTPRRTVVNVPFPLDAALLSAPTITPGAPVDFMVAAGPNLKLPVPHSWD